MHELKKLRKEWNQNQKLFRPLLKDPNQHQAAIQLFLDQHAVLHSSKITPDAPWSYEDILLDDLAEDDFRRLLPKQEHTIAWHIWHIARIEDITMHMLIAGEDQLFEADHWQPKLKTKARDTGNTMNQAEIESLSQEIDLLALRAYRQAVGQATRRIVPAIPPEMLHTKVEPARLQNVLEVGAVLPEAIGLIEYWGNRTLAGLLGMPPTRHMIVHLNQAYTLKEKMHR